MRLSLRLENWQLFESLELRTESPVTIVTGSNAAGKTALRDSVEFVLAGTGLLRGITTKQALAFESIRDGASATNCWLQFGKGLANSLDIGREMGRDGAQKVSIGRNVFTVSKGDARIRELLKADPERIRAALEADHVLAGDEKAKRALLVAVAGAEATRQQILEALMRSGLAAKEIERLTDLAEKDGFRDARATAEAERATRTRTVRAAAAETPQRSFQPTWATNPIDLEETTIETLRKREADLEGRIAEADRSEGVDRGRLEEARDEARRLKTRLEDALNGIAGPLGIDRDLLAVRLSERTAEAQATADERTGAVIEADENAGEASAKLAVLRAELAACEGEEGAGVERPEICPAIVGGPACGMTDAKLKAHAKRLAKRAEEIGGALTIAEAELATAAEALDEARRAEQAAAVALRAAREAEEAATRARGELVLATKAVENADAALAAAPEASKPKVEPAEGDEPPRADFFRTRLERCRNLIRVKEGYERAKEAAERDGAARESAETERAAWDRAAKILAPDGLPLTLLGAKVAGLQAYIDELDIAPIRLTTGGEFETDISGRWRGRRTVSESWQLRLSIAASHVVARASNFPLLVVDRFDHLDPAGRLDVLRGLLRVAKFYPAGILALATLGKKEPTPAGVEGVETIWLREGETERIG